MVMSKATNSCVSVPCPATPPGGGWVWPCSSIAGWPGGCGCSAAWPAGEGRTLFWRVDAYDWAATTRTGVPCSHDTMSSTTSPKNRWYIGTET
jgi:hypothetical protein